MPILPPNHRRSGRAPFAVLLALLLIIGAPLLLLAAPPQWWAERQIYKENAPGEVVPASDYSPANVGQLKHFAVSAYEYLYSATGSYGDVTPEVEGSQNPAEQGGVGWRLREALGQFVEFNTAGDLFAIKREAGQIVRKTTAATADYAMLNQGQLKAIGTLFYERLDAIYAPWPVARPWAAAQGQPAHAAPVTLGQLKHTFAFDLSKDSDGDGLSDLAELQHTVGGVLTPTNPFSADSDGDGVPDDEDTAPTDADRDGDGFKDGEDRWPDDPRRGDFIPPKFFAVTDLSAYLSDEERAGFTVAHVAINDEHEAAFVGIFQHPTEVDSSQMPVNYIRAYRWKDGEIVGRSEHLASWWSFVGNTVKHPGLAPLEIESATGGNIVEFSFIPRDIASNGTVVGSGWNKCVSYGGGNPNPEPPETSIIRPVTSRAEIPLGFTMETPVASAASVNLTWSVASDKAEPYEPWSNPRAAYESDYDDDFSIPGGFFEIAENNGVLTIFGGTHVNVGTLDSVRDTVTQIEGQPPITDKPDHFTLPTLDGVALGRFADIGLTVPAEIGATLAIGAHPNVPVEFAKGNLAPDGSMIFKKAVNRYVSGEAQYVTRYLYKNGSNYEEHPAPEGIKRMNVVRDANGDLTGLHQAIGYTYNSETEDNDAFFAWETGTRGNWSQMPLQYLLKWTGKPSGTKDDYDRYFARTPKNGQPAQAQIKNIIPKLLTENDPDTAGVVINGVNFEHGLPGSIVTRAEICTDAGWDNRHIVFEFDSISPNSNDWSYRLRFLWNSTGLALDITSVNSQCVLVGKASEQGDGNVVPFIAGGVKVLTFHGDNYPKATYERDPVSVGMTATTKLFIAAMTGRWVKQADNKYELKSRSNTRSDGISRLLAKDWWFAEDHFRVEYTGPKIRPNGMKIRIKTDSDGGALKTLHPQGNGVYLSEPTVLVSDTIDDAKKNPVTVNGVDVGDPNTELDDVPDGANEDATYLAKLEDRVRVELVEEISPEKSQLVAIVDIPVKYELTVKPIFVGDIAAQQGTWKTETWPKEFRLLKERYAQAAIKIHEASDEWVKSDSFRGGVSADAEFNSPTPVPGPSNYDDSYELSGNVVELLSAIERSGYKSPNKPAELPIAFPKKITGGFGFTISRYPHRYDSQSLLNLTSMNIDAICFVQREELRRFTTAHEVLHALLDAAHENYNDEYLKHVYLWGGSFGGDGNFDSEKRISHILRKNIWEKKEEENYGPLVKPAAPLVPAFELPPSQY